MIILRVPQQSIKDVNDYKKNLESIFLSSISLFDSINSGKVDKLQKTSLYKYQSRITTRPTPFGLFAGIGQVKIAEKTKVILPQKNQFKKHLRLDMNFIGAFIKHLEQIPEINTQLNWFPNTSLYRTQNKYRFIEAYFIKADKQHKLSAVDYSIYLKRILTTAQNGNSLKSIANSIIEKDISFEEAYEFVLELVNNQLLVSEIEPTTTTKNSLQDLIISLENLKGEKVIFFLKILIEIQKQIAFINTTKIGTDIIVYEKLTEMIKELGVEFDKSKLFQVDMFIPHIKGSVSKQTLQDVEKAIGFLKKLMPVYDIFKKEKEQFQKTFEDSEVSLFEVLDDENGIFYSEEGSISPLISKVYPNFVDSNEIKYKNTIQEIHFNNLYKKRVLNKKKVEKISFKTLSEDLKKYINKEQLPPTYSAMFRVFKENNQEKIFLETVYGNSAIDLLGRFAHLDKNIEKHIKELAKKEEEILKDAILVDIVHLPEDRTGNILLRPVLHKYQIPYLSKANVKQDFQILVSDLMLSVQGDRFVLRSKKLNKEIIPRLSNAHNYSSPLALPIYRFLCEMQNQNTLTWLGFSWGQLRNYYVFAPRVEFNNVILKLAEWQFQKTHIKDLLEAFKQQNDEKFEEELGKWQEKHKIPNKILLAEGENDLYINMQDKLARKVFVNEIKNKQSFLLKEFLMTEDNDTVSGPDGNYAHQFVASFINENYKIPKFEPKVKKIKIQRKFTLGSEWLYYKIYAGAKTLDHLLSKEIKNLLEEFFNEKLIDSWFFIRYTDPDLHLRIRFHFKDKKNITKVIFKINEVLEPLIEQRVIHKIDNEIYSREIERYGSNTMLLSEQLFYYDSKIITEFINLIEGDEGEGIRWLFALKMVDCFLSDFGFSLEDKIEFVKTLKQGFTQEFNFSKQQNKVLNDKYREERNIIKKILHTKIDEEDEWQTLFELLKHKSEITKEIIKKIITIKENDNLEIDFFNLISSYTHMTLNRLFVSQQRLNETAVYFLLEKYYKSIKAYNPYNI